MWRCVHGDRLGVGYWGVSTSCCGKIQVTKRLTWACVWEPNLLTSLSVSRAVRFLGAVSPVWAMLGAVCAYPPTALLSGSAAGVFCSGGKADRLWPRCWGCSKAKHCSANSGESSEGSAAANEFGFLLQKLCTLKKKCKVTDKHTKWWAVRIKAA